MNSKELAQCFQKLIDQYHSVTCAASDCMDRMNAMYSDMRSISSDVRLAGTALTVQTIAGDLSAVVKALELGTAGDIVVVDSHGSTNTAFWGENITLSAMNQGIIAAVVDGGVRDVEEIRGLGFPLMSRGIVPNVGCMAGYGKVNVPISCAGVPVKPGDIILIDGNGVVVVPLEKAELILEKTTRMMETETNVSDKLRQGTTIGKLINIDAIMNSTFAYQERAVEKK